MSFRSVFIAIVIGFGLVLAGFPINLNRPRLETEQPRAAFCGCWENTPRS
jgi:hypothetical protein